MANQSESFRHIPEVDEPIEFNELKLLPPPQAELFSRVANVDTRTLLRYLAGQGEEPENYHPTFDKRLDLSPCTPCLEEILREKKEGYIFKEARTKRKEFQEAMRERNIKIPDSFEQKAPSERSSILYYDWEEQCIKRTEIRHGDFATTSIVWSDVPEDGTPIIGVHTHPAGSLPSPVDYVGNLVGTREDGRLSYGSIVLCPNVAILALATPQTPLFESVDEAVNYVSRFNEEMESKYGEKKASLNDAMKRIIAISVDVLKKEYEEDMERIKTTLEDMELKGAKEEEKQDFLKKLEEESVKRNDAVAEVSDRAMILATDRLLKFLNNSINAFNIEFARRANIELYISFDMQHFFKFRA